LEFEIDPARHSFFPSIQQFDIRNSKSKEPLEPPNKIPYTHYPKLQQNARARRLFKLEKHFETLKALRASKVPYALKHSPLWNLLEEAFQSLQGGLDKVVEGDTSSFLPYLNILDYA
jgi:hypothetical protein